MVHASSRKGMIESSPEADSTVNHSIINESNSRYGYVCLCSLLTALLTEIFSIFIIDKTCVWHEIEVILAARNNISSKEQQPTRNHMFRADGKRLAVTEHKSDFLAVEHSENINRFINIKNFHKCANDFDRRSVVTHVKPNIRYRQFTQSQELFIFLR